jgi:two-component system sensor kinase FixL
LKTRLPDLFAAAADGIVVIDDEARILMFNKACEAMFGYPAADIVGRGIEILVPSENAQTRDDYIDAFRRPGMREVVGRHRDGTSFAIELSVGETMTQDGRQFVGILRDLRPRHETEQRLNRLQADLIRMARVSAMDEMGAALAHELNQPLTALMLYLQAGERMNAREVDFARLSPQVLGILEKAIGEAERAGAIIQRIRQFVEKQESVRQLLDLNPLIDDAVELTLLGHPPGIRVRREFASGLPRMMGDPIQIQQLVVNLVRNAVEAVNGRDSADILIATRLTASAVELAVSDNGPGIAVDLLPDLFKAFAASKTTSMGLGLAIAKTIAQNHGGELTADPGGHGRGACFTLTLPLPEKAAI